MTTVPETLATILNGQPAFLNQHFEVELATSPGPMFERVTAQEGILPHAVSMRRGISPVADLVSIFHMVRLMRRVRPDIVHSYTPKAGFVAMLAAWVCRVPVRIHTFTGLLFPSASGSFQKLLMLGDKLICAAATRVVPEGEGVLRDLKRYGITKKPLAVIGYGNISGVDCSYFAPNQIEVIRESLQLASQHHISVAKHFIFCFVGRINIDKGLRELMLAFQSLPAHAQLILVGDLDLTAPPDSKTMEKLRSHPRVHAVGFQTDIRAALAISNVLVLPSYREGFPNVILQASAMSLPVIATDINGCNEVIEPGSNGWLVPVKDVDALRAAMAEAMLLPSTILSGLGAFGRERVLARFRRSDHWQRMVRFYKNEQAIQRSLRP